MDLRHVAQPVFLQHEPDVVEDGGDDADEDARGQMGVAHLPDLARRLAVPVGTDRQRNPDRRAAPRARITWPSLR